MLTVKRFALIILFTLLSGCASIPQDEANPDDPFESFNRTSHNFNSAIDKAVLKPIAKGYDAVAPKPLKIGISNFFSNLDEIPTIINGILQGKFLDSLNDTGRLLINSTLGLAGFIDVATDMGLEQHDEDFGQTLGAWGFDSGAYIVLPFLGPSTVRDVLGQPVDRSYSLQQDVEHIPTRNSIAFMDLVDLRYRLLPLDSQLEDAIDEYSFVRDAFMMRREYQVYDGNPPEDEDFYDDFDDCDDDDEDCEYDILD